MAALLPPPAAPNYNSTNGMSSSADHTLAMNPTARRLLHDLHELKASPVARANAHPASDANLLEWHGNLMLSSSTSNNSNGNKQRFLHLTLRFPAAYPSVPPTVLLYSPLPHPNVAPSKTIHGMSVICLDMLETGIYADPTATANGTFAYSGWSSSYSVKSIMMQLQSFLLDLKINDAVRYIQFLRHIEEFSCPGCSHTPDVPWPSVQAHVIEKPVLMYIERPFVKDLLEIANAKKFLEDRASLIAANSAAGEMDADGWVLCSGKRKIDVASIKNSKVGKWIEVGILVAEDSSIKKNQEKFMQGSSFSILQEVNCDDDEPAIAKSAELIVEIEPILEKVAEKETTQYSIASSISHTTKDLNQSKLTKTALKNKKRNAKRKSLYVVSNEHLTSTDVETELNEEKIEVMSTASEPAVKLNEAGPFSLLPYEVLLQILNLLPVKSVIILSQVCQFLLTATEDGYVWKHLFNSLDSKLEMKGTTPGDWKHIYQLQMNGVVQDLKCFHRKTSFREDVLGIPIEFTINPVRKTVDYIHSTMDLLSYSAFRQDSVRKTVWSEKFTEWMPLYLSYDHFQRSLLLLKKSLSRLSPNIRSNGFDPIMVLEVLPKLMNTQIVLLCDNGLHNSDAFLSNYFQIHRIFLAMVYEYPQLKKIIIYRLNDFAKTDAGRHKNAIPSLGDLIPLLSVLPDPLQAWKSIGPLFLKESFQRSVLWAGRYNSDIAKLNPLPPNGVEETRIQDTFIGSATSLKLWATHVAIFKAISSYGSTARLAKTHDAFYGRPPAKFLKSLKTILTTVLDSSSFQAILPHFHLARLPFLYTTYSAAKLTEALRLSVSQSLKKGYHTKNTNFSRIHMSGVSKILRKGQSYRCDPAIKNIVMEESWSVGGLSSYLDATVLVYGFGGQYLDLADWCHHSAQNGSISHSGDMIVDGRGSHKLRINTKKLPDVVQTLVFIMTAWTGTLKDIRDPEVRLFDGDSMTELCRYGFDDCSNSGSNTCVVMCKLKRDRVGGLWNVLALGSIGMGSAHNYEPVKRTLHDKKLL
ncbi:hypothetical protein HK100_000152 [Physocladia obscura]|uniref:UBC core domain-containing protein n=1 Tax=Physocladia obscura TaxID=109957 RepID=A0AAD5T089_9FUNG|nr:hypothetical protein HK100_000152 [Physocladia obscura]